MNSSPKAGLSPVQNKVATRLLFVLECRVLMERALGKRSPRNIIKKFLARLSCYGRQRGRVSDAGFSGAECTLNKPLLICD